MTLTGEQRREYAKNYYHENKEAYKERQQIRRRAFVKIVAEIKGYTPCTDCGVQYPPYVMQFDHLPGTEKESVLSRPQNFSSITKIFEEMDKCEVVCANCHAIRTWTRRQ